MRTAFNIILFGLLSLLILQSAEPTAAPGAKADPIVGKWRFFNDHVVTITADGRLTSSKGATGTWTFANDKELERKYSLNWQEGLNIDEMRLSRDGKHLEGKNQRKDKVSADRVSPQIRV